MKTLWVLATCSTFLVGCSGTEKPSSQPSPTTSCTAATAAAVTRAFVDAKGFTPSCAKAKHGVNFVLGNVDDKAHTISTSKASPQVINAELPNKNSLFSVKLNKVGTYNIKASGGATLTLYITN